MAASRGPRHSGEGGGKEYSGSYAETEAAKAITSSRCFVEEADGRRIALAVWIERHPARPLPAAALKLLIKFHRLIAYREAVIDGVHDPLARRIFFEGIKDRQIRSILDELGEDSPHDWFTMKVGKELAAGRIPSARDVLPGPDADAFYIALAGGKCEYEDAAVQDADGFRLDAGGRINGSRQPWFEREAAIYSVFSLFR